MLQTKNKKMYIFLYIRQVSILKFLQAWLSERGARSKTCTLVKDQTFLCFVLFLFVLTHYTFPQPCCCGGLERSKLLFFTWSGECEWLFVSSSLADTTWCHVGLAEHGYQPHLTIQLYLVLFLIYCHNVCVGS